MNAQALNFYLSLTFLVLFGSANEKMKTYIEPLNDPVVEYNESNRKEIHLAVEHKRLIIMQY